MKMAELWQWKDLFNRLTPTERKDYFEGLKVETKTEK